MAAGQFVLHIETATIWIDLDTRANVQRCDRVLKFLYGVVLREIEFAYLSAVANAKRAARTRETAERIEARERREAGVKIRVPVRRCECEACRADS